MSHGDRGQRGTKGELRELLLPPEPALRRLRGGTVRDVSTRPPGWAPPTEPAAFRVSPGTPPSGRVGVSLGERTGRSARLSGHRPISFSRMYWPLIGGFIAVVLLAVLMGWIMDTSRHRD